MNPYKAISILFLCFASILAGADKCRGANDAAQVLSVNPGVLSILSGNRTSLQPMMDVPIKASVKSDRTGNAQLMFPDDSTITISPGTEIALAEFVDTPRKENIVLDLAVGTARVITGEVSRRNPLAFTVNTPQAVIGIRGTVVTITVIGDTTRIYLSETSGRGVSVRNRHTGATTSMRSPGMIIRVTPSEISEHEATAREARSVAALTRAPVRRVQETGKAARELRQASRAPLNPGAMLSAAFLTDTDMTSNAIAVRPEATRPSVPENRPGLPSVNPPSVPGNPPSVPSVPIQPENPPSVPSVPDNQPSVPTVPDNPPSVPSVPETPPSVPSVPTPPANQPSVPETPPSVPENPPSVPSVPDNPPSVPSVPTPPVNPPSIPDPLPPSPPPDVRPGPDAGNYVVDLPMLAGTFTGGGSYVNQAGPSNWDISMKVPGQYALKDKDLIKIEVNGHFWGAQWADPGGFGTEFTLKPDGTFGLANPGNVNISGQFTSNNAGSVTIDSSNAQWQPFAPNNNTLYPGGVVSGPITKQ